MATTPRRNDRTSRQEPPKATWRDWLIEDGADAAELTPTEMITRDEVLDRVNAIIKRWNAKEGMGAGLGDMTVSRSDLALWEYRGILPRPIRQRHEGATRALYPEWFVELVYLLRVRQWLKWSLAEIRGFVRAWFRHRFSTDPRDVEIRANTDRRGDEPTDIRLPDALIREAQRVAGWHARLSGFDVARVELTITDVDGRVSTKRIPYEGPDPQCGKSE